MNAKQTSKMAFTEMCFCELFFCTTKKCLFDCICITNVFWNILKKNENKMYRVFVSLLDKVYTLPGAKTIATNNFFPQQCVLPNFGWVALRFHIFYGCNPTGLDQAVVAKRCWLKRDDLELSSSLRLQQSHCLFYIRIYTAAAFWTPSKQTWTSTGGAPADVGEPDVQCAFGVKHTTAAISPRL